MLSIYSCHQDDLSLVVVSILLQIVGVLYCSFLVLHATAVIAFTRILHAQKSPEFFNFCIYSPFLATKLPKEILYYIHTSFSFCQPCPCEMPSIRAYATELTV